MRIVGFDIVTSEDTAAWTAFLRSLVARGLCGVELVISDAHGRIKNAIAAVLGEASWQRCRTHFMAMNLASRVPKASWPMIATMVRSMFEQPDRDTTWTQLGDVVDKLTQAGFVDVADTMSDTADDILAFSAFPVEHSPQIRSNNPQERLNKRDPPTHRRRRHLPQPVRRDPSRRRPCSPSRPTSGPIARRYMSAESLAQDPPRRQLPGRPETCDRGRHRDWLTNNTLRRHTPGAARSQHRSNAHA